MNMKVLLGQRYFDLAASQDFKVGSQPQVFYILQWLRQSAIRASDSILLQQRNPRLESCPTNSLLYDDIRQNHFGERLLV